MRYIETYEAPRMIHSQESRVSSSQDALLVRQEHRSNVSMLVNDINSCLGGEVVSNNEHLKVEKMAATSNQDGKKSDSVYPWLSSFGDACQTSLGSKSNKKLEHLMKKYQGHILGSVKECYTRPNRAAKLRKCINDTLLFFHLYYQDVREPGKHSAYLDLMTELVSMYVDMEIKAASRQKERVKKITCRLTSALYIFLDKSEDHVLDAILKAKLINKHNRDVCLPILGKLVNQVPSPLNEMSYVRYLLIFKLFKKVTQNSEKGKQQKAEEGKRINKLAVLKLKPPANFVEKAKIFINVLPKIPPKSKKNITHFFMQAKLNLKSACTAFVKSAREFHETLYGASKEVLFSKSVSADLSSKSDPNASVSNDTRSNLDLKSLTENLPSRNLSARKELNSKKPKEKVKKKNKKVMGVKNKEKDLETIRKKKLKKNKILDPCGDSVTVLENKLLGSKKGKGDKNKKGSNVKMTSFVSSESTDESVSLPEIIPTADSVHREISVLNKLSLKGLANFLASKGNSFSSGEVQNIGSSGIVVKQEISNGEDMPDIVEVPAETSVSGVGREQPSTSVPTSVPSFNPRSTICTSIPPPSRPCYTSPPPPPPPHTSTSGHELPSTTTPRGGPSPYVSLVPTEYLTTLPPKRNTDSRAASPAVPITRSSTSPHMPVCSSSVPSPRRNLGNICSGLPAGFTPSIPPPPLPSYAPRPPTSAMLSQNSLSFQPPLPRSPAPPLPPLPVTPAPVSPCFSLPLMSLLPPSLALISTIPPPPPPPTLSHPSHLSGHPPPMSTMRPGLTPPNHPPPSTPPPPVRPPPTPPHPPSLPPPPPSAVSPSPLTAPFSSPSMHSVPFSSSVPHSHLSSTHVSATPSHTSGFSLSTSTPHMRMNQANIPNINSVPASVCHTPPPRSCALPSPLPSNIPSPHTPYAPTPPPSCTPTPPSPSGTPPPSPRIHTRPSPSPSLPSVSFSSTPPLIRPSNSGTPILPSHSLTGSAPPSSSTPSQSFSPSSPSPSFTSSFPTCTPASPSPSPTPSRSPSPSPSLSTSMSPSCRPTTPTVSSTPPPSSLGRVSTPPTSCKAVSSLHSSIASSPKMTTSTVQTTSVIPSKSVSPPSPSPSCSAVFSSYTPASPSPSPSPSCSPSPTPSRSPSPSHSHSPSPSPASSPSPSYTPMTLSPTCTPTPSSPLRVATPTSCKVTSLHSPVLPTSLPSSASSRSTVKSQSPAHSRSDTPVIPSVSVESTPPPSSTVHTTVTTSTISTQTANSVSVPSSTVVCTPTSLSTPTPLQNHTGIQTNVSVDAAISVAIAETSPTQTPPMSPPTTPLATLTLEQPTTTTFMVDTPSEISQTPAELLVGQHVNKCKGPCDSSPGLLGSASVIPCFPSSIVAPSEERIIDVGAEVEVEVEDEAETEVEADTMVSQVVEESQESVVAGNNREQTTSEEVHECSGEKNVTCDSAGENILLADTEDVYSNECEVIGPEIQIKGKTFSEVDNVSSVIAPLGQARGTVIASGGGESLGPSSSGIDSKHLVASQICKPKVQENEAIASGSKPGKVCRDSVSPRIVRDPVLLPSPIPNDTEPEAVTYSCDSLITSVSLVEEGSPNNEDSSVPMDMDRDIMDIYTYVPTTTTLNDDVVHDFIDGSFFGKHNIMTLDTSRQELGDSQAIGMDDQGFLMMHLGKNYFQFVPDMQDNMVRDAMLHPCNIMMEEDDVQDGAIEGAVSSYDEPDKSFIFSPTCTYNRRQLKGGKHPAPGVQDGTLEGTVSSDDEPDKSFNSSPTCAYNRRRLKGEKHPAPGVPLEDNCHHSDEKEVSDSSPSSSVENETVLRSYVEESRSKGLALAASTPKRKPAVNHIRYGPVEQTLPNNTSESREDSSAEESPSKMCWEYTGNSIPQGFNYCTVEVIDCRDRTDSNISDIKRSRESGIQRIRNSDVPDLVQDAQKAEGQREQEPKSSRARRRNTSRGGSRGGGTSKPNTRSRASSSASKRGRKRASEPQKACVPAKSKQSKTKDKKVKTNYSDRPVTRSFFNDVEFSKK